MAYTRKKDIEDVEGLAGDLAELLGELVSRYSSSHDEVASELKQLQHYAEIIARKAPKIATLRDFKGYKFAIIDEQTGQPRNASHDEAMRLIMGYKQGNIIDLLQTWVVINGEWVRKPKDIPPVLRAETEE